MIILKSVWICHPPNLQGTTGEPGTVGPVGPQGQHVIQILYYFLVHLSQYTNLREHQDKMAFLELMEREVPQ